MTHSKVTVPWREGLNLRSASVLANLIRRFHSRGVIKSGGKIADLRCVFSVLALCAFMGTTLEVEASGEDERDVIQAVESVFFEGALESALRVSKTLKS